MAKPKTLSFIYNDKKYVLEFDRNGVNKVNVSFKELERLEEEPEKALIIIPKIWHGAFFKHHPEVTYEQAEEMLLVMKGRDEKLPAALVEMYAEPLVTLFSNEGNVAWTKSW